MSDLVVVVSQKPSIELRENGGKKKQETSSKRQFWGENTVIKKVREEWPDLSKVIEIPHLLK